MYELFSLAGLFLCPKLGTRDAAGVWEEKDYENKRPKAQNMRRGRGVARELCINGPLITAHSKLA